MNFACVSYLYKFQLSINPVKSRAEPFYQKEKLGENLYRQWTVDR